MPHVTLEPVPDPQAGAVDEPALVPYLTVAGARAAIAWYAEGLGARLRHEPMVMPDGRIGHAELAVGDAVFFLADESPDLELRAPAPGGTVHTSLSLHVDDCDLATGRAADCGARVERPPGDQPYGRVSVVRDPFGHRWMLRGPVRRPAGDRPRHGDLAYVSLQLPDVARAERFFTGVLGWRTEGSGPGRKVNGLSFNHGLWEGAARPTLFLCFGVDDLDHALDDVRAAGGVAGTPVDAPHGRVADCTDNQGVAFALYQLPADAGPRNPENGAVDGDVAYVTVEVPDSAAARAFYGAVLGWRFAPGRVPDGFQVEGVAPMVGLRGGVAEATVVPMYRVADVGAAVERVRAAGGAATDPSPQPYGRSSLCADDQGTRFYLGEL